MPDGLYEHDALAWAERQSDLLRRVAAGERLNEDVDWEHVIEEIHDVGLSQLRACRSLLRQVFLHLLKLHAEPGSQAAAHWRGEIRRFLIDAEDCFTPSMRQRLDLDAAFARAFYAFDAEAGGATGALPPCPFSVDELFAFPPDISALLAKLDGH